MSTPKNPLELVDRYLQAVRFWMPKTQKQDEILAELGDDLRSQIEEKEQEFGRPLSKDEVSEMLKRCGAPMIVAGRLAPKRYLIGPTLFPIYAFVLKMVLLWILLPVFAFIVGPATLASTHGDWGAAVGDTIGALWSGLFIAAGIITLVFAILERTHTVSAVTCKWNPSSLPPLQKSERKTSFAKTFSELVFNVFGLMWLLLVPHHPFLIMGPAAAFLTFGPIWHVFYLPWVLLAGYTVLRLAVALARPQWTAFPLWSHLAQNVFTLFIVHYMIDAAGSPTHGGWHPFVTLAANAIGSADAMKLSKIAAIVNVSLLLSLVCMWIGVCIATGVQTWQLIKHVRKQRTFSPASVQAL